MSATGRSRRTVDEDSKGTTQRLAHDGYSTPAWVTRVLLDSLQLPSGRWFEPCAGDGAIIQVVNQERLASVDWDACEIRSECGPALADLSLNKVYLGDFLEAVDRGEFAGRCYDVILTNPPFSLAEDFVNACLPLATHVVFLLRLNFLEGAGRAAFWRERMADVYVLPNRPSFTGKGTDATAYAWMHWTGNHKRREGRIQVLPSVPVHARKS